VASGKVARRTVVSDVAELLNSPEIAALIVQLGLAGDPRGRKGYGARTLIGACLVKSLYGLPTWTLAAALIAEHPGLQAALGGAPSCWACYRFCEKLRANRELMESCLDSLAEAIRERHPDFGQDVAIDASDLTAFANGQRYVRDGGPERERYSDPDASWGHRSAVSTRKGGGFYGYKIDLAVCTRTGLPLAWQTRTARHHESLFVADLLDAVRARGFQPETVAMDKGYDIERVHAACEARGCHPVVPMKGTKGKQVVLPISTGSRLFPHIPRHTDRFRKLYAGRSAVEREFGRLKHDYGLAPLRVRGLARVQLHVDLTILARLALALGRAQEISLAA
jgi:hypothetical protein